MRYHIDEATELFHGLYMLVASFLPRAVRPCFIEHGSCRLPRSLQSTFRISVVGHHRKVIPTVAQASAHHTVRLELVYEFVKFLTLFRTVGTHVEPQFRYRTVVGQEFSYLSLGELVVLRSDEVAIMAGDRIGVREVPVDQREVDGKVNTSTTTSVREFLHIVALRWSGIYRVIRSGCGLEHTETVVVLGGNHDGTHTGFLSQSHDFVGIEFHRVEFQGCIAIPVAEDTGKRLDLFAITECHRLTIVYATIYGVKTEMDKHGILVLVPLVVSVRRYLSRCADAQEGYHQ